MSQKTSFWDILDTSILKQDPRHSKNVSMYPSEASAVVTDADGDQLVIGGCKRKSWFRNKSQRVLRDKPYQTELFEEIKASEFTANDLWKFKLSSGVERDLHHEAKRAGVYYDESHKFEWIIPSEHDEEILVRGEVDLVIYQEPDSTDKVGIEVKSITGYYGQRLVFGKKSTKGHWIQKPEPKADNLLQAVLYTLVFCTLLRQFTAFKLVYISRENGERNEFDITLVPEIQDDESFKHRVYIDGKKYKYTLYAEDIMDSYKLVQDHVIADTLPPRDYALQYSTEHLQMLADKDLLTKKQKEKFEASGSLEKGDWQCSYCQFRDLCYDEEKNPIEYSFDEETSTEEFLVTKDLF